MAETVENVKVGTETAEVFVEDNPQTGHYDHISNQGNKKNYYEKSNPSCNYRCNDARR